MGRGAEAGKADDSVDTDASTAPKMSGETGDAPSASETTESHGGRPPSGAGASTSFENGQKGVHRPGLVRRLARSIPMVGDLFLPSDGRFGDGAFDMRIRPARGRTSPSTDEGTEKGTFRERVSSFSSLLNVQKVSQKVSDTLEQQIGRFGPAGIEIYRFAWQRFNRRVAFHIAFYSVLGSVLFVLWALAAWQLWLVMGLWAFRRFILMLGVVVLLAMLPPSFPNAAAHGLSLALVAAELCLLGVNLVLFGLVHLAVLLNKYILPHWFHRGLTVVNEISSGVIDHDGRARSVMTGERNKLLAQLFHCESYRQWLGVASQLDKLPTDLGEGGDEWRKDEARSSDAYDAALCKIYLTVMRQARGSGDAAALGLSLRTVLHRNFGGMDRLLRLRHARTGTKLVAEEFVNELCRSVRFLGTCGTPEYDAVVNAFGGRDGVSRNGGGELLRLATGPVTGSMTRLDSPRGDSPRGESIARGPSPPPGLPPKSSGDRMDSPRGGGGLDTRVPETLRLISEAHRSLGRTALCLSGGGALAMYHFGVIKVLLEEGLLPQVVSGTSGGSIVAAFISMFPEEELLKTIKPDLISRHSVRWFPPLWKMILHFVQHSVLMSGDEFARTTEAYFGDVTFAEAFAISKRAVSIQISVGSGHGFVLNHFTSPQVVIRTAVNASCALPGLMPPSELLAKEEATGELIPFHPAGVTSFDGTITADIPAARLTELFNCNNFIVSQVNPHVNFVLHLADDGGGGKRLRHMGRSGERRAAVIKLLRVANFLLLNIKYGMQKLLEVDLLNLRMVRTLQGILVQDFRGHVTILPELKFSDYLRILHQPSEADMAHFISNGERATWPHIEAIRLKMAGEIALQEAAAALRARLARQNQTRHSAGDATAWARQPRWSQDGGGGTGQHAGTSPANGPGHHRKNSSMDAAAAEHLGAGLSCAVTQGDFH